ncbi:MAG: hypothetical protein HYX94_02880 [Chloroflexi bacterium]|nr:hypothetical protein [Chloroflexota bacterium]
MRVLVIPEDFRKDQFVLQPVIAAMMDHLKVAHPKVLVCRDPLLGGVDQALKWERIEEIIKRYQGMVDIFLLCVDRDGKEGRRMSLDRIEDQAGIMLASGRVFVAENAWQELEVWVLAGHDLPPDWRWKDIRSEVNPKETYFYPFVESKNLGNEPGEGRRTLATEAARNYPRVRSLCPEDIGRLETRLRQWLAGKR